MKTQYAAYAAELEREALKLEWDAGMEEDFFLREYLLGEAEKFRAVAKRYARKAV